jgi:hypothetical protein
MVVDYSGPDTNGRRVRCPSVEAVTPAPLPVSEWTVQVFKSSFNLYVSRTLSYIHTSIDSTVKYSNYVIFYIVVHSSVRVHTHGLTLFRLQTMPDLSMLDLVGASKVRTVDIRTLQQFRGLVKVSSRCMEMLTYMSPYSKTYELLNSDNSMIFPS